MLPNFDRADRIGSYWGNPKTSTFAELLIDCEEDRTLRAVLVGMLRERRLDIENRLDVTWRRAAYPQVTPWPVG
jgi:hypothetical protein